MKQDDESKWLGRRALIRLGLATGAALGVPQWKVFEVLEGSGGKALAQEASCATTNRSVHIVAGTGGFAWFNLLWPHNDVAAAGDASFAWHAIGEERLAEGTHRPLTLGPESPWQDASGARQVSCFMAGTNETHTQTPQSSRTIDQGVDLFGACAAVQTASPTVVPVVALNDAPFGQAPGAPRVARVGSADGFVDLFGSAAARDGGLLSRPENAELFHRGVSTFLSLRRAAGTSAFRDAVSTSSGSARLLGENLRTRLEPTVADLARYGVDGGSRGTNRRLAEALIVSVKAFRLGLTQCVLIPAFGDDPHGAFNDMQGLRRTVGTLGQTLDAFIADLRAEDDPTCGGRSIADNTVLSIHGDTPKTPLTRQNWPDGTPNNSNWIYVLGAGLLKTGWFGGVMRDGSTRGFNPLTGAENDASSASTANSAAAAVLYAVAKGDLRRVSDFYRGTDLRGIVSSETV